MIPFLVFCSLLIPVNLWAAITPHMHSDLTMRILHGCSTLVLMPLLWTLWAQRRQLRPLPALLLAVFALLTPLGVWGGSFLFPSIGEDGIAVAVALAAGTFLYVCLTELLPEVFHHREDILAKIVLLALGIAAMGVSMAVRPVLNAVYRSITGHQPPRAENPSVPFGRALVWTLFSATTGAVLELVVQRVSRRILDPRG